jgi:hypothetical protein
LSLCATTVRMLTPTLVALHFCDGMKGDTVTLHFQVH